MINAEDYPYNPQLRLCDMKKAVGLERLCWIADRVMAQHMADLYENLDRNTNRAAEFEKQKLRDRRERLIKVAEAGKRGDHGPEAFELAHSYFQLDVAKADLPRLESYLKDLQKLNIDVHSMPSRRGGQRRGFRDE